MIKPIARAALTRRAIAPAVFALTLAAFAVTAPGTITHPGTIIVPAAVTAVATQSNALASLSAPSCRPATSPRFLTSKVIVGASVDEPAV